MWFYAIDQTPGLTLITCCVGFRVEEFSVSLRFIRWTLPRIVSHSSLSLWECGEVWPELLEISAMATKQSQNSGADWSSKLQTSYSRKTPSNLVLISAAWLQPNNETYNTSKVKYAKRLNFASQYFGFFTNGLDPFSYAAWMNWRKKLEMRIALSGFSPWNLYFTITSRNRDMSSRCKLKSVSASMLTVQSQKFFLCMQMNDDACRWRDTAVKINQFAKHQPVKCSECKAADCALLSSVSDVVLESGVLSHHLWKKHFTNAHSYQTIHFDTRFSSQGGCGQARSYGGRHSGAFPTQFFVPRIFSNI